MVYRIDYQHFLTHAIDYLSLQDLTLSQYVIISAKIRSGGRAQNMIKLNELYPTIEIILMYDEMKDSDAPDQAYYDFLKEKDKLNVIFTTFIHPLQRHQNIIIICMKEENYYIDVLCKFLKKECGIDVIDLNKLFSEGKTDEIYIDREEIDKKSVDIKRAAAIEMRNALSYSSDGRKKLLGIMSKKEKKDQLKRMGIKISKEEEKDIDNILFEAWEEE